ncbi:MAG: BlaI/MecI/CopY family transcriptional regulator [Candidatus Sumerlaeia bacterium]
MTKKQPDLTPMEWAIMRVLWERGEAIARDVWAALEPTHGWAQTTVRTMLDRLAQKGWLKQKRIGPVFLYKPAVARDKAIHRTIRDLADRVSGGDLVDLVAYAVREADVSDDELARLEQLIRERKEKKDEPHRNDE